MADQSLQNNEEVIKLIEIGLRAEDAESGICNVVWRINDAIDPTNKESIEKHVIELVKILIREE